MYYSLLFIACALGLVTAIPVTREDPVPLGIINYDKVQKQGYFWIDVVGLSSITYCMYESDGNGNYTHNEPNTAPMPKYVALRASGEFDTDGRTPRILGSVMDQFDNQLQGKHQLNIIGLLRTLSHKDLERLGAKIPLSHGFELVIIFDYDTITHNIISIVAAAVFWGHTEHHLACNDISF